MAVYHIALLSLSLEWRKVFHLLWFHTTSDTSFWWNQNDEWNSEFTFWSLSLHLCAFVWALFLLSFLWSHDGLYWSIRLIMSLCALHLCEWWRHSLASPVCISSRNRKWKLSVCCRLAGTRIIWPEKLSSTQLNSIQLK